MSAPLLIVPGWGGSGPAHWQTSWERALVGASRVEMADWMTPSRADWIATLDRAIRAASAPPILVAHSLGCLTVVHWAAAAAARSPIRAALLVAPPDVDRPDCMPALRDFAPCPRARLAFPSRVVASDDDPYADAERSAEMADDWGSALTVLHAAGHINSESGFGPWPAGRALLEPLAREERGLSVCESSDSQTL